MTSVTHAALSPDGVTDAARRSPDRGASQ